MYYTRSRLFPKGPTTIPIVSDVICDWQFNTEVSSNVDVCPNCYFSKKFKDGFISFLILKECLLYIYRWNKYLPSCECFKTLQGEKWIFHSTEIITMQLCLII